MQALPEGDGCSRRYIEKVANDVLAHIAERAEELGKKKPLGEYALSDWVQLCELMGILSRPVCISGFKAVIIYHRTLGWVIYYDKASSARTQCRHHAHEVCEYCLASGPVCGVDYYATDCPDHGGLFRHNVSNAFVALIFKRREDSLRLIDENADNSAAQRQEEIKLAEAKLEAIRMEIQLYADQINGIVSVSLKQLELIGSTTGKQIDTICGVSGKQIDTINESE